MKMKKKIIISNIWLNKINKLKKCVHSGGTMTSAQFWIFFVNYYDAISA